MKQACGRCRVVRAPSQWMTDHPRSGGTQSVAQPLPWSKLTGWAEAEPGFQQGMCNHPPMCLPKGCQCFCKAGSSQLNISQPRGAPAHGWPDSRKQRGLSAPQPGRGLRATCTTLLVGSPGHSTPRPACARLCPQLTQLSRGTEGGRSGDQGHRSGEAMLRFSRPDSSTGYISGRARTCSGNMAARLPT